MPGLNRHRRVWLQKVTLTAKKVNMAYVYTGKLESRMPTTTVVEEKHPAGICASYTCDYIKKRLAGKVINLSTYEDTKKRLQKLINRQKSYERANDLKSLFDSYGIERASMHKLLPDNNGNRGEEWNDNSLMAGLERGIYYVAFYFAKGSHAIAFDKANFCVADANAGVYKYELADQLSWQNVFDTVKVAFPEAGELRKIEVIKCRLKNRWGCF